MPPERVAQAYLELAVLVRALEGLTAAAQHRGDARPLGALGRPLRPARQPARPRARGPARPRRARNLPLRWLPVSPSSARQPRPRRAHRAAAAPGRDGDRRDVLADPRRQGREPGGRGRAARRGGDDDRAASATTTSSGWPLAELERAGVDMTRFKVVDAPTGVALITVDADGENVIVVAPGANTRAPARTTSTCPTATASSASSRSRSRPSSTSRRRRPASSSSTRRPRAAPCRRPT